MRVTSAWARRVLQILALSWCCAWPAFGAPQTPDEQQVVAAVRALFDAATHDDLEKFRAITLPEFYAFDVGQRMTGDELMGFIRKAHAAGKVYVWEVTEPQVHVHGEMAWITWVNRGSVQDASGRKDQSWLESAVLRKSSGGWRIHFLHSTRVPPA